MAEYFIYNNDNFLPEYFPGITGYGQRGANGNIGNPGSSVYYSSIILVADVEDDNVYVNNPTVNYKILHGEPLSNNSKFKADDKIKYRVNDIIIDRTGKFYVIKSIDTENKIVNITSANSKSNNNISEVAASFKNFIVYCNTAYMRSNARKWAQPNSNYVEGYNDDEMYFQKNDLTSPKVYHDNKGEYIFGNFVKFELTCESKEVTKKYQYKYVLCFPNGQVLETTSSSLSAVIFVENKLLFGCFDVIGWNNTFNFNISDLNTTLSTNKKETLDLLSQDVKLGDTEKCSGCSYNKSHNFNMSDETNTLLCSYFIKHNCSAYVEISNIETGQTYRLETSDFIYSSDSSDDEYHEFENIRESITLTNWLVENKEPINIDNETSLMMNNYVFLPDKEEIFNEDFRTLSEDGYVQNVYFVGAAGFNTHINGGNGYGIERFLGGKTADERIEETQEFIKIANAKAAIGNEACLTYKDGNNIVALDTPISENEINQLINDAELDNHNNELKSYYAKFLQSAVRAKHLDNPYNDFNGAYKNWNKTLKLKFKDVEQLVINIIYNKYNEPKYHPIDNSLIEYPLAKVYISGIDVPLISSVPTESQPETGIYYYAKVVPPGYKKEGSVQGSDAGIADITINVKDLNLDPHVEHVLEIGVALLEVDEILAYLDEEERDNINAIIDSMHEPTKYSSSNIAYSFLTPGSSNEPELKIFISSIMELSDDYTSAESDNNASQDDLNTTPDTSVNTNGIKQNLQIDKFEITNIAPEEQETPQNNDEN